MPLKNCNIQRTQGVACSARANPSGAASGRPKQAYAREHEHVVQRSYRSFSLCARLVLDECTSCAERSATPMQRATHDLELAAPCGFPVRLSRRTASSKTGPCARKAVLSSSESQTPGSWPTKSFTYESAAIGTSFGRETVDVFAEEFVVGSAVAALFALGSAAGSLSVSLRAAPKREQRSAVSIRYPYERRVDSTCRRYLPRHPPRRTASPRLPW